jgi:hypothetical protein
MKFPLGAAAPSPNPAALFSGRPHFKRPMFKAYRLAAWRGFCSRLSLLSATCQGKSNKLLALIISLKGATSVKCTPKNRFGRPYHIQKGLSTNF